MKWLSFFLVLHVALACLGAPVEHERVETDPELIAGYFQGDMVLDGEARNGMVAETRRWPDKLVYYKFFTEFDAPHRNHILRGMEMIESISCIRFKEAGENQTYFVNITGLADGCYSHVGWSNSVRSYNLQLYPLDAGCFRLGTIVHEFLHTLGFHHMQSTHDRDEYVYIAEENIQPGYENNFIKYDSNAVDNFDTIYDYASVLHYSAYALSINGKMTIVPLKEDAVNVMGQRLDMSRSDIHKLNAMYVCPLAGNC